MNKFEKILKIYMGYKVKDVVTQIEGIVTSISFDLYGCIQAVVNRGIDENNNILDSSWYDINRLIVISDNPVMDSPHFKNKKTIIDKGPSNKPELKLNLPKK